MTDPKSIAPIINGTQYFDQNGNFLAGGKVYAYTANAATTKLETYADKDGVTINPNPITLDSQGQIPTNIWLKSGGDYNIVVTQPDNETVLESINGVSTQQLIAGDHITITPDTGVGIVTISAAAPDPVLGHGNAYYFTLTSDDTFYFDNTLNNIWNCTTLVEETPPDVEWDNDLQLFRFNKKGSYTIELQTTITPLSSSNMPTNAVVCGFVVEDNVAANPITRSCNPFYGMPSDGSTNDFPEDYQRISWYDNFTVSMAATNIARTQIYAYSPTNVDVSYTALVNVIITRFDSNQYQTATPQPAGIPVASFTYDPHSGTNPLQVTFTDTSTGDPSSWLWEFGDGSTSTEQNPTYEYTLPGEYTVTMTCSNIVGTTDAPAYGNVSVVAGAPPTASFTPTTTTGNTNVPPGLVVNFTDTSTGNPTAWHWDFGDGNTSTQQNPTHIYTVPQLAAYNVSMYCTNTGGTSNTATGIVNAYGGANWGIRPVASYTVAQNPNVSLIADFTDTSTNNPDTWVWNFYSPTTGNTTITQHANTPPYNGNIQYYFGGTFGVPITVTLTASQQQLTNIGVIPTSASSYVTPNIGYKAEFSFAPNDPPYNVYIETDYYATPEEATAALQAALNARGNLYIKIDMGTWYTENNWIGPFQLSAYSAYSQWASAELIGYNSYYGTSWHYYYPPDGQTTTVPSGWDVISQTYLTFS